MDELLEIHFLDLTKLPKENLTSLEKWLMFIKTDSKEERAMLARGNPVMAKANKVMDIFYLDEQERKRYEAAWEYESDRLSMISESEQKGLERGKLLGLVEGEARGSRQKALETAKIDNGELGDLINHYKLSIDYTLPLKKLIGESVGHI